MTPVAEAPAWLLELIARPPKRDNPEAESGLGDVVPEGQRNGALTSHLGYLRNAGSSEEEMLAAALVWNSQRCKPPLDEGEVRTTVHSVARYEVPAQLIIEGKKATVKKPALRELITTPLAEIVAREQRYLWDQYLPVDQLIALYGPSHVAKTVLAQDLAARITVGAPWPDQTPNLIGPRKILLLAAGEDALETVVKPRFALAGADPSKVLIVKASRLVGEDSFEDELVALDRDADLVRQQLQADREIALVVIDPVTNHLGQRDLNAEKEIRPVLMRLRSIAEDLNVPLLAIGHLNKRQQGTAAFDRTLGARSFTGVPRTIYFAGSDNTSTDKHAFVLVQGRGLGAPSWKYHTELAAITVDGADCKQVRVAWDGTTNTSAADVVDSISQAEKTREAEAAEVLTAFLNSKSGEAPTRDCVEYLAKMGYSTSNPFRVRGLAGVATRRPGKVGEQGAWYIVPTVSTSVSTSTFRDSVHDVLTEDFQQKNLTLSSCTNNGLDGTSTSVQTRQYKPRDRNVLTGESQRVPTTCSRCHGTGYYKTATGFAVCECDIQGHQ